MKPLSLATSVPLLTPAAAMHGTFWMQATALTRLNSLSKDFIIKMYLVPSE